MADRIVFPTAEVRRVAGEFRNAGEGSQDIVNRIQNEVNNLQSQWEGMAQNRFYSDYQTWAQSMTQYIQLLQDIAAQLDATAQHFEDLDRQLASRG